MKKKTPHLDFYKHCIEFGRMPVAGLCISEDIDSDNLMLFKPTKEEFGVESYWYWWAYDGNVDNGRSFIFSPMRQTIVLFLAAMNNEL